MSTTRPTRGAACARAITTLAGLALAGATHAGTTTIARWAAPVSGSFYDAANWINGTSPTGSIPALLDATGSPHTVTLTSQFGSQPISITLDSDDVTLFYSTPFLNNTAPLTFAPLTVTRGELRFGAGTQSRDLSPIVIGAMGRFSVEGVESFSRTVNLGRDLTLDGVGRIDARANLNFAASTFFSGFPTPQVRIGDDALLTLTGQNIIFGGIITNRGTIHVINDPDVVPPGTNPPFGGILGAQIGDPAGNTTPINTTWFNNDGLVIVDRSDLRLSSHSVHSGEFRLGDDARLLLGGSQTFLAGSRVTGGGLTTVLNPLALKGMFTTEGDLRIQSPALGPVAASIDVAGTLDTTTGPGSAEFLGSVRVGILKSTHTPIFRGGFDGALLEYSLSPNIFGAEFHGQTIIRSDIHAVTRATFHSIATIQGDASRATFYAPATIQGNAVNVELDAGGQIAGSLSGDTALRGTTTIGSGFSQLAQDRSRFATRLNGDRVFIGGDVDIRSAFFESSAPIVADGSFFASGGVYSSITADTIRFAGTTGVGGTRIGLQGRATLQTTTDTRVIIDRAMLAAGADPNASLQLITFADGFEINFVPLSPATRSGFQLRVDTAAFTSDRVFFGADSLLAGTLDVLLLGDASALSAGDSFTLLAPELLSVDATLTGQFDRLFLPTLTRGLSFDLVYDANTVRLVVVPTPSAAAVLALAGVAAFRRRSR